LLSLNSPRSSRPALSIAKPGLDEFAPLVQHPVPQLPMCCEGGGCSSLTPVASLPDPSKPGAL